MWIRFMGRVEWGLVVGHGRGASHDQARLGTLQHPSEFRWRHPVRKGVRNCAEFPTGEHGPDQMEPIRDNETYQIPLEDSSLGEVPGQAVGTAVELAPRELAFFTDEGDLVGLIACESGEHGSVSDACQVSGSIVCVVWVRQTRERPHDKPAC